MNIESTEPSDLLVRFQDWIQIEVAHGDASRHTQESYLSSTRVFFAWCQDRDINLITATEDEIKLYRAHLIQSRYKRGTIGTCLLYTSPSPRDRS